MYDLYAILVHSGGAYGGHYYVYIKSFEDCKWYNFNDTRISELDVGTIPEMVFGGQLRSGYMMLYRQVGEPTEKISEWNIPEYLRNHLKEQKHEFVRQQEIKEE